MLEFDWDDKKNDTNHQKHGIWFEDAESVFNDPLQESKPNCIVNGEERWQTIGMSKTGEILKIIYTVRDNGKIIRIISARLPTPKERRYYEYR